MTNILIVHTSMFGNTHKFAQSVSEGAKSVANTEVRLRTAGEATLENVRSCDALILGTPIHMGMLDWRIAKH